MDKGSVCLYHLHRKHLSASSKRVSKAGTNETGHVGILDATTPGSHSGRYPHL